MSFGIYKDIIFDDFKKRYPNANKDVLDYISTYISRVRTTEFIGMLSDKELVDSYEFATHLQKMFNCGSICWACPSTKFVWLNENIPYGIDGVFTFEYEYLIPIDFIKDYMIMENGSMVVKGFDNYNTIINDYIKYSIENK